LLDRCCNFLWGLGLLWNRYVKSLVYFLAIFFLWRLFRARCVSTAHNLAVFFFKIKLLSNQFYQTSYGVLGFWGPKPQNPCEFSSN
jgi:hypothetical protein